MIALNPYPSINTSFLDGIPALLDHSMRNRYGKPERRAISRALFVGESISNVQALIGSPIFVSTQVSKGDLMSKSILQMSTREIRQLTPAELRECAKTVNRFSTIEKLLLAMADLREKTKREEIS